MKDQALNLSSAVHTGPLVPHSLLLTDQLENEFAAMAGQGMIEGAFCYMCATCGQHFLHTVGAVQMEQPLSDENIEDCQCGTAVPFVPKGWGLDE